MTGRAKMILLAGVLLSLCLSGCGMLYRQRIPVIEQSDFTPIIEELAATNTEFFNNPYTLIVMLDSRPCGVKLSESIYWSDWRRHMIENGNGFVFATSRADSAGVVYAAHLDSADAPVLVIESYEERDVQLSNWRAFAPFHFLADSTGELIRMWVPASNQAESDLLLKQIDSLIAIRNVTRDSLLLEFSPTEGVDYVQEDI